MKSIDGPAVRAALDTAIFAVHHRPVAGGRGDYRVSLRHGVSEIRSGERYTLGIHLPLLRYRVAPCIESWAGESVQRAEARSKAPVRHDPSRVPRLGR